MEEYTPFGPTPQQVQATPHMEIPIQIIINQVRSMDHPQSLLEPYLQKQWTAPEQSSEITMNAIQAKKDLDSYHKHWGSPLLYLAYTWIKEASPQTENGYTRKDTKPDDDNVVEPYHPQQAGGLNRLQTSNRL